MGTNQKVRSEYYVACADKIIAAMQSRQMECIYFETKKDMLEYLKAVVPAKATASWGGSMTLYESGVIDLLRGGLCKLIDRDAAKTPEEAHKCMHQAFDADFYFLSANAITMDGKLVNIDGNGNRVAALIYGPKQVFVIAGMNTADDTLEELIASDVIVPGVDQAGLIRDIEGELALLLNDHNITRLFRDGSANHIDQTFGFSGALQAHDETQHIIRSFSTEVQAERSDG